MKIFIDYFEKWNSKFTEGLEGVSRNDIARLERLTRHRFPENYTDFLMTMGKGERILSQCGRLETSFGYDRMLWLQEKYGTYHENHLRISWEWNIGTEHYLNLKTNEIEYGCDGVLDDPSVAFDSLEMLLFTFGLKLAFENEPCAKIGKKPRNTSFVGDNGLLINKVSKIAKTYNMVEVPFIASKLRHGFICKEAYMLVNERDSVEIAAIDPTYLEVLIEEITEKTHLKVVKKSF